MSSGRHLVPRTGPQTSRVTALNGSLCSLIFPAALDDCSPLRSDPTHFCVLNVLRPSIESPPHFSRPPKCAPRRGGRVRAIVGGDRAVGRGRYSCRCGRTRVCSCLK